MKADHPLERAIPAIRLGRRRRRGERVANFHLTNEEERLDLIGSMEWPSPLSRRLSHHLLDRVEQQPGAVLHAWWMALYHGRQRRRGHCWMVGATEGLANYLGEVLGTPHHPQAQAVCAKFPPQWNLYAPWEDLVRQLTERQHPKLQQVIVALGRETLPRTLTVSGFLPSEGSQEFVRFLMATSDPQTRRWWFPAFLEQARQRIDQPKCHPWQAHGFKALFGRTIDDVAIERYAEQLDVLAGLGQEDWVRVGREVADMFVYFQGRPRPQDTCVAFMDQWLNAEGPWDALELPNSHPIVLAMSTHPRLRRAALLGGLGPQRVDDEQTGERRAL